MAKKQILFSIIAFLVAFIITLIITFPINAIASKIITDVVTNNKIDLQYDKLNITFFGASIDNIKTGPLVIKNIKLDYNPLGLVCKRIVFKAESSVFMLNGRVAGNEINADIKASVAGIAQITGMTGSGSVDGIIKYNIKNEKGSINLTSPNKVSLNHPLMPISVDSLQGQADIDKNKLTINNLSAKGTNSLNINGYIDLNKQKIDTSVLNISGEASMGNYPLRFNLVGPARSPKLSIK